MAIEFEAKVLDIDVAKMTKLIIAAGGRQIKATTTMRRYVYDIVPGDAHRWIRLRDTGHDITLTVKEIHSDEIDGTEETEIAVEDFATTHLLLTKLGFVAKSYQENKRTSYVLDGAQLEVDEWPLIPPYLEIEGSSRDAVLAIAERLDIPAERLTGENTIKVYARYGIDLTARKDLRF